MDPAHETHAYPPPGRRPSLEQRFAAVLILASAVTIIGYRWLVFGGLTQTAALFVGLPAVLAACLAYLPSGQSATARAMQGVTVALLVSGMFLGEGILCIVVAAPIFYGIALVVGAVLDIGRARGKPTSHTSALVLAPLLLLSLEGTRSDLALERAERAVAERLVAAPPAAVEAALARPPRFARTLPRALRAGFPLPERVTGGGIALGDRCVVLLAGGEGQPGELVLEVCERSPGRVVWRVVSDGSHVAHWVALERATVEWEPASAGHTRVRWTIEYRRLLDPAWYFRPIQRYCTRLTAGYLIDCLATPGEE